MLQLIQTFFYVFEKSETSQNQALSPPSAIRTLGSPVSNGRTTIDRKTSDTDTSSTTTDEDVAVTLV